MTKIVKENLKTNTLRKIFNGRHHFEFKLSVRRNASEQLRWPKWLTFHFHTTSQFRILNSEFRNLHYEFRDSELEIVKYIKYGQGITVNLL